MTRISVLEYAKELRVHYAKASKQEKGKMLDQFTMLTGCRRKAAIRLLYGECQAKVKRKKGRPRQYGRNVASALRAVWEASDRLGRKRLRPFLSQMVAAPKRHGEVTIVPEVWVQLRQTSPARMDRLLYRYRLVWLLGCVQPCPRGARILASLSAATMK
jgi:hypothetical protein